MLVVLLNVIGLTPSNPISVHVYCSVFLKWRYLDEQDIGARVIANGLALDWPLNLFGF